MQPKRILISLLVVILALLSAGTVVSAEDSPALDMAVEVVSSSTAMSDNLCLVKQGDVVTVSVTIKSNPGIAMAHFDLYYDPAYLRPTVASVDENANAKFTPSGVFPSSVTETVVHDKENGKVTYSLYSQNGNVTGTGKIFTFSFMTVKHGNTELMVNIKQSYVTYWLPGGVGMSETGLPVTITHNNNAEIASLPVKIHNIDSTYKTIAPSCTVGGQKAYTCSTCNQSIAILDGTPALGHTPEVIPSVPATCVQDGLTEGKKCSTCDAIIQAPVVAVPKNESLHTVVTDPAVAPTCSSVGYTEGSHCSSCDKVIVAPTEVAAKGHTYGDWVNAKNERTKTCSVCGDKLTEALTSPAPNNNNALLIVIIVVSAVVVLGAAAAIVVVVLKKKKVV